MGRPLGINWKAASKLLGTMSDGDLAWRLSCSPQCVAYQRKKRGIPRWCDSVSVVSKRSTRYLHVLEHLRDVGPTQTPVLARALGLLDPDANAHLTRARSEGLAIKGPNFRSPWSITDAGIAFLSAETSNA